MFVITSSLIILSNFVLKITDDILDEDSFEKYRSLANIGILFLTLAALLIITDPEGMLLSGSIIFSAPLRKKADTIQYKWVVLFLLMTFPCLYLFSAHIPNFTVEKFIDFDFVMLFLYFFVVYALTSFIYEFTFSRIERSNFVLNSKIKISLEIFLAIIIYHAFILIPVILNSLTIIAFITSILSFFAYILGSIVMKLISSKINTSIESQLFIASQEIETTPITEQINIDYYFIEIIENDVGSNVSTRIAE